MIVRTWSGSKIELTKRRLVPWVLGWVRAYPASAIGAMFLVGLLVECVKF